MSRPTGAAMLILRSVFTTKLNHLFFAINTVNLASQCRMPII